MPKVVKVVYFGIPFSDTVALKYFTLLGTVN